MYQEQGNKLEFNFETKTVTKIKWEYGDAKKYCFSFAKF